DRRGALRDAEPPQQIAEPLPVPAQAGEAVVVQRATGHVVRDEGIAVAIPADPGAELEEGRHGERRVRIGPRQRTLQLVPQLGHDVEQVLGDEVQPPGELLLHRRLLEAQLAGEPQQLDLRAEVVDQGAALAGHELGRRAGVELLAPQHALELRLVGPNHVDEAVEEQVGCALQVIRRVDHTTRSRGGAPAKKAVRFSSARSPMAARVSAVALPRWGSSTTFSSVRSSGGTSGSRSKTSSAAPAIVPRLSASTRA